MTLWTAQIQNPWVGQDHIPQLPLQLKLVQQIFQGDSLNENVSDKLSRLAAKTVDSQLHKRFILASQTGYEKSQKEGKNRYVVVGQSNNMEASVWYYINNWYKKTLIILG